MEKAATPPKRKTAAKSSDAPKKTATRTKKTAGISPEIRVQMISDAAYFRAQNQGSSGDGDDIAHWLAAEAEIDMMLKKGGVSS